MIFSVKYSNSSHCLVSKIWPLPKCTFTVSCFWVPPIQLQPQPTAKTCVVDPFTGLHSSKLLYVSHPALLTFSTCTSLSQVGLGGTNSDLSKCLLKINEINKWINNEKKPRIFNLRFSLFIFFLFYRIRTKTEVLTELCPLSLHLFSLIYLWSSIHDNDLAMPTTTYMYRV